MTWLLAVVMLLTAALFLATPRISRPTVPLGVSVPRARIRDDVVLAALRRYGIGVVLATLVSLLVLVLPLPETTRAVGAPLMQVALSLTAFVLARRPIQRAKREQGWYDGVPVRLVASLGEADEPTPVTPWPHVAAVAIGLAVLGHGAMVYPRLPDRLATHGGFDGTPDTWSAKSPWVVLGLGVIPLTITAVFAGIAWLMHRFPGSAQPDGDLEQAMADAARKRHRALLLLGQLDLPMTSLLALLVVFTWHDVRGWPVEALLIGLEVAPLVLVAGFMWRLIKTAGEDYAEQREHPSSSHTVAPGHRADSPDDDRLWKGGVIYVNRDDPRTLVPKRSGIGLTVNAARPGGMVFYAATVVLLVAAVVLPLVLD